MRVHWWVLRALQIIQVTKCVLSLPVHSQSEKMPDTSSNVSTDEGNGKQSLREMLKKLSKVQFEEELSATEKIDHVIKSLLQEDADCLNVTWYNIVHHSIFGNGKICA